MQIANKIEYRFAGEKHFSLFLTRKGSNFFHFNGMVVHTRHT